MDLATIAAATSPQNFAQATTAYPSALAELSNKRATAQYNSAMGQEALQRVEAAKAALPYVSKLKEAELAYKGAQTRNEDMDTQEKAAKILPQYVSAGSSLLSTLSDGIKSKDIKVVQTAVGQIDNYILAGISQGIIPPQLGQSILNAQGSFKANAFKKLQDSLVNNVEQQQKLALEDRKGDIDMRLLNTRLAAEAAEGAKNRAARASAERRPTSTQERFALAQQEAELSDKSDRTPSENARLKALRTVLRDPYSTAYAGALGREEAKPNPIDVINKFRNRESGAGGDNQSSGPIRIR